MPIYHAVSHVSVAIRCSTFSTLSVTSTQSRIDIAGLQPISDHLTD